MRKKVDFSVRLEQKPKRITLSGRDIGFRNQEIELGFSKQANTTITDIANKSFRQSLLMILTSTYRAESPRFKYKNYILAKRLLFFHESLEWYQNQSFYTYLFLRSFLFLFGGRFSFSKVNKVVRDLWSEIKESC